MNRGESEIFAQLRSSFDAVFPPSHALYKLWVLWSGKAQEELFSHLLPDSDASISRLRSCVCQGPAPALWEALGHAACARLAQLFTGSSHGETALDEAAFLYRSQDDMQAWLFLFPPAGPGKSYTAAQLHQVLARHGVTHGIDWTLFCQLCAQEDRSFTLFPLAVGTAPVPGRDGEILDRYPREAVPDLPIDELGTADEAAQKLVQPIAQNAIICEILPPTAGTPGCTVTGNALPAPAGKDAAVPQGRNTCLSQDGRYLLAACPGHVAFSGRSFQVKPVLELSQEDALSEKSIKFLGDIHIHGDLCCGTTVYATGNIQVDGVVEACTIEAGENIIVSGGVQGQGHAVLHAQKSVYVKYLEHCNVYARERIWADCIINCNLHSNGTVQARTGRGAIIGGIIRAAREVSAITVGSKAERPTTVILGGLPCEQAERDAVAAELERIEHALAQIGPNPGTPEAKGKSAKLRLNSCVAKMKLEKFDKDLQAQLAPPVPADARRLICDSAYPGTVITIDHGSYRVSQLEHGCVFGLAGGLVGRI